jgi:hypothetical protein
MDEVVFVPCDDDDLWDARGDKGQSVGRDVVGECGDRLGYVTRDKLRFRYGEPEEERL